MYIPLPFNTTENIKTGITTAFSGFANDINSTLQNNMMPLETKLDSVQNVVETLLKELNTVHTFNRKLVFKLLVLEGKFTQEQVDNMISMINSNDVASVELAKEILKNEGYEYIF
jgi:translation initiation factor 2 beta subunit (eIF-2beta)/eIF-5